jgi:Tfp pilus assembly protein PilZ
MSWCVVCGTQHADPRHCPEELLATGTERHGRRWTVTAKARTETYGVLVAPAGELWRARIVTYPGMLWSVPGGRATIKFVGGTAGEVEDLAAAFVEQHCSQRGYRIVGTQEPVESGSFDREAAPDADPRHALDERHPHALPVQFGEKKASEEATTSDLSERGMFIVTRKPLPVGRRIRISVALESFTIPMTGHVVWVRTRPEKGRPIGMGVELPSPPPLYVRYDRRLQNSAAADGEKPGGE